MVIGRTAEEVRDWWVGQIRPIREGRGQWCGGCPVVFFVSLHEGEEGYRSIERRRDS